MGRAVGGGEVGEQGVGLDKVLIRFWAIIYNTKHVFTLNAASKAVRAGPENGPSLPTSDGDVWTTGLFGPWY